MSRLSKKVEEATEALKEKGIEFYNVPAQSYDVSQGVMAYILAYSTNLLEGDRSMKCMEWRNKPT